MAPEQVRGEAIGPATDIYALGVVLFEMVTGRRAIKGDTILEVLRNVDHVEPDRIAAETPEPFAAILRRALARDPSRRRSTMAEIADALASADGIHVG